MTATLNTTVLAPLRDGRPLLVVAPSIGTSALALWEEAAKLLAPKCSVLGVDLPGHGVSRNVPPLTDMASLAQGVLAGVREAAGDMPFYFAGVSVSGCIGLQLVLDAPEKIAGAAILNSAAKIGEYAGWMDRAKYVRGAGTAAMRDASAERWFAPGFMDRNPARAKTLLDSLAAADAQGYAGVCEALAAFDVRDKLAGITRPVIAIGGTNDVATPPAQQEYLASAIPGAAIRIIPGVAHLAPAENPADVADALAAFFRI